jgi:hypothetical protein
LPIGKDGFGEHHVDAFVAVDQFSDVEIGGDTREHVSVVAINWTNLFNTSLPLTPEPIPEL